MRMTFFMFLHIKMQKQRKENQRVERLFAFFHVS